VLHEPVLSGVVGDDGKRPTRGKTVAERGEGAGEAIQLVVDGDADGLEETSEIGGTCSRAERAADSADQIVARAERAVATTADDLAREAARARLISKLAEDALELPLVGLIEELAGAGDRVVRSAHSHVEGRTLPEGEAARRVVDLMRGDAKVEQDPGEA